VQINATAAVLNLPLQLLPRIFRPERLASPGDLPEKIRVLKGDFRGSGVRQSCFKN
jgi:hypothetical protein